MATKFKKGDVVKLVAVVPQGPIEALRMDEAGNFFYLVSWVDVNKEQHQRWFAESELVAG